MGAGLATKSFSVDVNGSGASGSTPPSAAGTCTASYTTVSSWPGGFQGQVKLTNTSGTPLNG